ncbi:2-dehydro-3-deoxygluconokinase [Roseomonas rosea]|uniref:2-dehydro-3-deoxygluconokinase n=1 Tax=Muricoccus roseus TaxID=198092 RepID=A0A1M6ESX3_9PROT|nr:sugar kinase [Roseomonas rosea]SHI88503.1 2-dehydro-3-deoxygluconokinase [Roseomonas rosea]
MTRDAPPRLACLGECMIELRERPDGLLSRGFGGDTLNTAVYLARLGVSVDYVTALGNDPHSDEMLRDWEAEGVGTSRVERVSGALPGLYLIQTDEKGERRFSYWRDAAPVRRLFDLPGTQRVEAALAMADPLYLSGITLSLFRGLARERLFAVLERVRAVGGRVVFDSNFRPRGWPDRDEARAAFGRALSLSHTVLAGVEDFTLLDGETSPRALITRLRQAGVEEAVVKLAEPGAIAVSAGAEQFVPVPEAVEPVDTTAAGDSFAAAYLAARLNGAAPDAAILAGHRLAGRVIQHPGAIIPRSAMPAGILPAPAAPETA